MRRRTPYALTLTAVTILLVGLSAAHATWQQVQPANSPPARTGHSMVQVGNSLYIFGGRDGATTYNDVWKWDGTNWTQEMPVNSPPPARHSHAASNANGRMQIIFGTGANGTDLADMWEYDPNQKFWFPVTYDTDNGIDPAARREHTATYVPDQGRIYVSGGLMGFDKTDESLYFDPSTFQWQQVPSGVDVEVSRRFSSNSGGTTSHRYSIELRFFKVRNLIDCSSRSTSSPVRFSASEIRHPV